MPNHNYGVPNGVRDYIHTTLRKLQMPNHVTNILKINGTPNQVEEVRNFIRSEDDDGNIVEFDFDKIIPMPQELDIASNGTAMMVEDLKRLKKTKLSATWMGREVTDQMRKDAEPYLANLAKHGYVTWHDWCVDKWGTKWGAYSISVKADDTIQFETAWSAPLPIFEALAARFPEVEFVVEYADEDIGRNLGRLTYKKTLVERFVPGENRSKEAEAFAYRIKGYTQEMIDEIEQERRADENAKQQGAKA